MQMSANDQFELHVIKLLLDPWYVICPPDWLPVFHLELLWMIPISLQVYIAMVTVSYPGAVSNAAGLSRILKPTPGEVKLDVI